MRYLITGDSRQILAVIDVPDRPDGESRTIALERADRPDLMLAGADLYADGTVVVGHWPDGEDWERVLHTAGVPDQCGHSTPALPDRPVYTRAQIVQALADARARTEQSTEATTALNTLEQHVLAILSEAGPDTPGLHAA